MKPIVFLPDGFAIVLAVLLAGCNPKVKGDLRIEEPPRTEVEHEPAAGWIKVEHPERFPVSIAVSHGSTPRLNVTGVVSPDVSRSVPVVSLASGRVVEIRARLGDRVTKGQLLVRIQSPDISEAVADYHKAVADEMLARASLDRAKILYGKGAIAQKDLEVAVDTETNSQVVLDAAIEHLKVLGADLTHLSPVVDIIAPASGVITEQNITAAAGVKSLDNSPNLFTITDLSRVWIVCDVYENDLASIHLNDVADVRLNAYPDKVFQGRISDIGSILDPAVRTAKARIEVDNSGFMRLGMFAQATFRGQQNQIGVLVPASAILHLQDRDWVYLPHGGNLFRRAEVRSGGMVPPGKQLILSGIRPGDRVVKDALLLQSTSEQNSGER